MPHVEIQLKGLLDSHWSEWFDDLTVTQTAGGKATLLSGRIADQAGLYRMLIKARDLGLPLISVTYREEMKVGHIDPGDIAGP